jgi:hypothetical protein
MQPVLEIMKENNEYETLVDRIQNWCQRIQKDNERI